MTNQELIEDLRVMIKSSRELLSKAVEQGDRTEAHRLVDAIIDTSRELEDQTR